MSEQSSLLDVTNWTVRPYPNAGAVPKLFVTDGARDYMLKFAKKRQNGAEIPYHVSEFISCRLAKSMGYNVQDVSLAMYHGQETCLVELFDEELITFTGLGVSTLDEQVLQYDLDIIDETVKPEKFLFDIQSYVWKTFLLDSFICNLDRHPNNWGFFRHCDGYVKAPLFDLGSSLYSINACSLPKMKDVCNYIKIYSGSAVKYQGMKYSFRDIVVAEKDGKLSEMYQPFVSSLDSMSTSSIDTVAVLLPRWKDYCSFVHEFICIQKRWYHGQSY